MFGTWIAQIQEDLRKKFPASKNYSPIDFRQEPMPVSVGHFLEHALSRRAAMIQVSVDTNWFDKSSPEVAEAEKRWREALAKSARYPAKLWEQSVDQAVSHVASFLISPADSFAEFATGGNGEEARPAAILNRLAYFRPYSSLRSVIKSWVEGRGGEMIAKEDLRIAIMKADRSIVADYDPSDWIALLQPLFELAAVLYPSGAEPEVPTAVLKPLFEAKAADEVVRRIEAIESIGGHRKLSEIALLKALGPTEIVPEPEPEPEPMPVEPEPPAEPAPVQLNDMHAKEDVKAMPRWMQFAQKVEPDSNATLGDGGAKAIQPPVPAPDRVYADYSEEGLVGGPRPVSRPRQVPEDRTAAGHPAVASRPAVEREPVVTKPNYSDSDRGSAIEFDLSRPLRVGERAPLPGDEDAAILAEPPDDDSGQPKVDPSELRVLGDIGALQRAWFINNLFGGDYKAFSHVIGMLDRAEDWQAASSVIGLHVFERNDIDIYSQAAIEFTNAVEARFR